MTEETLSQVKFEIEQIDQLLAEYEDLLKKAQKDTPDLIELTALASVLHSFYNGLENIFSSVAKGIDQDVPTGAHWHRQLLTRMTRATEGRGPVLKDETAERLADYLGFRHFYRHSYSFFLDWTELEQLVIQLMEVWQQVKDDLKVFLVSMELGTDEGSR